MCLHAGKASGAISVALTGIDPPDQPHTPPVNNCTIAGPGAYSPYAPYHLLHYVSSMGELLV